MFVLLKISNWTGSIIGYYSFLKHMLLPAILLSYNKVENKCRLEKVAWQEMFDWGI